MVRIRRIKSTEVNIQQQLLLNIFEEQSKNHNSFLEFLHSFLPNKIKRITENFAAIEDKKILSVISLKPQSRKNARWHINRLCVGDCTDETLIKLINFAVSKYGADGVETFITFINEKTPELKQLFLKYCNFRGGAHLNLWSGSSKKIPDNDFNKKLFSKNKKEYAPLIAQLHNQMIFPQYRQSLSIAPIDFKNRFKDSITNKVIYCESSNSIEGYFLIFKREGNLYLELLLSDAYDEYYPEILKYCSDYIEQGANILVKKFHTSSKKLEEVLDEYSFNENASYAVLIKDYWAEIKKPKKSSIAVGAAQGC